MKTKLFILLGLLLVQLGTIKAQERTITVSGSKTYNLSPNEIVIQISYKEYYLSGKKVKLIDTENKIKEVLKEQKIKKSKITYGSTDISRRYNSKLNIYEESVLNKVMYVCLNTSEEYVDLNMALESTGLLKRAVSDFSISEYRHRERSKFMDATRSEAYQDALNKATLILTKSEAKVGKVVTVKEFDDSYRRSSNSGSFYTLDSAPEYSSGFKPLTVTYKLDITFEII